MSRVATGLLKRVDAVSEDDRAPKLFDRYDLSAIPWDAWGVDHLVIDTDREGKQAAATCAEGQDAPPATGLADVPWMLWAIEHPCEAEQAEEWLRATDAHTADGAHAAKSKSAPERAPRSITPWMLWAIDHPCEAERAEAWLDDVAAGEAVESSPARVSPPAAASDRRTQSIDHRTPAWQRAMSGTVTAVLAFALILVTLIGYGRLDNRWYHLVTVQGGSMEPTYSIGDVLVLTRPPENVEVGMVLTMQVDGSIVTHRVVEVSEDGSFVTQGDANDYPDDFAGLDVRVVGQVRGALPWVGRYLGGRASTNAWFTDRAVASAFASAATTLPLAPVDQAAIRQAAVDSLDGSGLPEEEPPSDSTSEKANDDNTETKDAVADESAADETTADAGVSDEPEGETTVTSQAVDEAAEDESVTPTIVNDDTGTVDEAAPEQQG